MTTLVEESYKRGTLRKTLQSLAMILDHERVTPNPARDRVEVRLPREDVEELNRILRLIGDRAGQSSARCHQRCHPDPAAAS